MIPARPNHMAAFKYGEGTIDRPVVAWDDDGYPLVIPEKAGFDRTLRRADAFGNFSHVHDDGGRLDILSIMPAGGWRWRWKVKSEDGSTEETFSEPLIGWAVCADGLVRALAWKGWAETLDADDDDVYHPDADMP